MTTAFSRGPGRPSWPDALWREQTQQPAITVVICAHNSARRLPDTLRALAGQTGLPQRWELVVVDNASTDDTSACCTALWDGSKAPLRLVREERPGLAYARQAGVAGARGAFLCFVDDDNHLAPTYLRDAYEIMVQHPDVGIVGGCGEAVVEGDRPSWMWCGWQSHAVGPQGAAEGYVDRARGFVYGAGAVIRRSALEEAAAAGFKGLLSGRMGSSLGSGEDVELCFAVRLLGWRVYYSPRLRFGHWMPERRMTWEYCLRLFSAFGQANAVLEHYEPWLKGGARSRFRRSLPGVLAHELLELRRLWLRNRMPMPGSKSELLQRMEAKGKRDEILNMLRSGRILRIQRELRRFAKAAETVRRRSRPESRARGGLQNP